MKKVERQEQILRFLEDFSAQHRYPPTVRDIQEHFNIKSTATVFCDLNDLANEGKIERVKNRFVPNYTESYLKAIRKACQTL